MNSDLSSVSPLAAYVGSFLESSFPAWGLISLGIVLHWFFLVLPPVIVIGYLDRKLGADIQMRIGPNRVSAFGVFQFFADTIKLIFKQESQIAAQEGWLFRWGIVVAIICVFSAIGNIPMATNWAISNLDSGLIYIIFALVFSHLCLFWSAYSIENQWSAVSSFRVLAMISAYIVPVAVALVPPVVIAGSHNIDRIVRAQGGMPWRWLIFHNPGSMLSGVVLFVAMLIWQGRVPFDHYRAESEVNGGFTAGYSGFRRGLLIFLEYGTVFLSCAVVVTTYLGGWQTPFDLESFGRAANLVEWLFFSVKTFALAFLSVWIRWSLPRLRIDQIVKLAWHVLVPLGLFASIVVAVWIVVFNGKGFGDFL